MKETLTQLQGVNSVLFVRRLADAPTVEAQPLPYQTALTFDPSTDSDSTATKDGSLTSASSIETDLEVEFVNSNHFMADQLRHALFNGDVIEMWVTNKDRTVTSEDGKTKQIYGWYMRGHVQEDSNDNDADDLSTRDVTFTIDGTPKDGWLELSDNQQKSFDYIFRGLGVAANDQDKAGGIDYDPATDGAGRDADTPSTVAVTGVKVDPATTSIAVGKTAQLTATVSPDNATDKSVAYSTGDATVATVDNKGLITAVKAGTTKVTATTTDGKKTADCAVTVTPS